jgi:N-acetylglutamate synthase-like GNAT family acetyltransferase
MVTKSFQVRPAIQSDLEAIKRFDEFGGSRQQEIASGTCLVAENEEIVIGYTSYEPRGLLGQPLLTFLCVHPDFRRQGTATALVIAVQSTVKGRKLISSTEDWCVGTQHIFERLGWSRIGQISEVNKDGSVEWFYAISLNAG